MTMADPRCAEVTLFARLTPAEEESEILAAECASCGAVYDGDPEGWGVFRIEGWGSIRCVDLLCPEDARWTADRIAEGNMQIKTQFVPVKEGEIGDAVCSYGGETYEAGAQGWTWRVTTTKTDAGAETTTRRLVCRPCREALK